MKFGVRSHDELRTRIYFFSAVLFSTKFIINCTHLLQGLKLELSTGDRVGLLSDVTRIFRENGLTVTRAEVSTKGDKAINTFYVRDAAGSSVELKTLEAIRQEIGQTVLQVKGHPDQPKSLTQDSPTRFLFSSLFRPRSLCNLGLIGS